MCNKFLLGIVVIVLFGYPLAGCVVLETPQILGQHLAAAVPAFAALDPQLVLGPAPMAGATRVMRSSELAALARRLKISQDGSSQAATIQDICFERAAEALTAQRLQPVLAQALGVTEIEILDFRRVRLPVGPAQFEFTKANLTAPGFWRGRVLFDGNRSLPVWVKIAPVNEVATPGSVPRAGRVGVEKGEKVEVEVHSGAVHLSFAAQAESAARLGESILLRNPENGHLFQAKVLAKGKVAIHR